MKNKIIDVVFFDGANTSLLDRRIKYTSDYVNQTIILLPTKFYDGSYQDTSLINSFLNNKVTYKLIDKDTNIPYQEWIYSIMQIGLDLILKELPINYEDIFLFSRYNEFPDINNLDLKGLLNRGPLSLRMEWLVENFPLKSKDSWMGTIIFNRSQSRVTENIVKVLQSSKNEIFSFRYNILNNGYFFSPTSDEIMSNFQFSNYNGEILKNRFEVYYSELFPTNGKLRDKKIIDCFIFNNEIDLLKQRIRLLDGVVDHFVLIESKQTHSGINKIAYFEEIKSEFSEFLHKIEHIIVDLPNEFLYEPTESDVEDYLKINWFRENYHRNEILRGLYNLDLIDHDIILISDIDEIPDPSKLNKFISSIPVGEFRIQTQKWFCWDLNRSYSLNWPGTAGIRWIDLKKTTPQIVRSKRYDVEYKNDSELFGWHCSWFGGINQIMSKLSSFAHQELKDITIEDIENKMTMNLDIHGQVLLDNNDGYDPEFI
jgi:beta-1,4-mannosyl-glycoprotein beta-1,4-N-acetylglucosaminyltransferase